MQPQAARHNHLCALRITLILLVSLSLPAAGIARAAQFDPQAGSLSAPLFDGSEKTDSGWPGYKPTLFSQDESGLTLELVAPPFELLPGEADGQPCQVLRAPGFASSDQSGQPELPVKGAMLGIPAWAEPKLSLLESDSAILAGRYTLCPVAQPAFDVETASGELPVYAGQVRTRSPQAYASPGFVPQNAAELIQVGFIRSQKFAQVRFQPFQYDPTSGELRYFPRLRLRLDFAGGLQAAASPGPSEQLFLDEGSFEPLLRDTLLNYTTARQWRSARRAADTALPAPGLLEQGRQVYKLLVSQDGIYQVTYANLSDAGADLTGMDPNSLRLFYLGEEQAIRVVGGGDHSFDPGDYLVFYGQKVDMKYTGVNVYELTWGGEPGLRMAELDGAPGSGSLPERFQTLVHAEQNPWYLSQFPSGVNEDVFYWDYVNTGVTRSYTLNLAHISFAAGVNVTLRGLLRSRSTYIDTYFDPQHTKIYLNGQLVDDHTWENGSDYLFELSLPQSGYLLEGSNTIAIECPSDFSGHVNRILVNWIEAEYWHTYAADSDVFGFSASQAGSWKFEVENFTTSDLELYDITDPGAPAQMVNFSLTPDGATHKLIFEQATSEARDYLALPSAQRLSPAGIVLDHPSNLKSADHGADYLVISHADFVAAMQPLADYRASQGLRTLIVDVEDVYDEFSAGRISPEAIRDFLAYAYANWQPPAPAYVLLVGDGNFDPRNYLGTNEPVYIPPFLTQFDPYIGESAADNRFVTIQGSDNLPDMYLGRFPVKTSAQAEAVVAKILAYEQNPTPGDWNAQALFVTDNTDSAGNFPGYSDNLINGYLPPAYTADKIYYTVTHTAVTGMRTAIPASINQGRLLVNYIGHSSIQAWGAENFFNTSSIASLQNAGKLPFMVMMTCLSGSFHYPSASYDNSSLAEVFLRSSDRGAIASWAATGMGLANGQDYLNRGLFTALFTDQHKQIGMATLDAKFYLYSQTSYYRDLLDSYTLFGDPAMQINLVIPPPAGLGNRVWQDANSNGVQDASEPGVPGVSVTLYDANGDSLDQMVTDGDGLYHFSDLTPGSYSLYFEPPAGYVFASANQGADPANDSDPDPLTGRTDAITLASGQDDLGWDAGLQLAANLAVAIDASQVAVAPGEILTYTLSISNLGPATAFDVQVQDSLPSGLVYLTSQPAQAESISMPVWYIESIAPGEQAKLELTVAVPVSAQTDILNSVVASSATPDVDLDNNSDVVTTEILLTPLTLEQFDVTQLSSDSASVTWFFNGTQDLAGFRLYRTPFAEFSSPELLYSGQLGETCVPGSSCEFTQIGQEPGLWWYWLARVSTDGSETLLAEPVAVAFGWQVYIPLANR